MNEDTLMKLVDKLAEKLGVAVEELTPLALETLRQYQLRAMVEAIVGMVLLALAAFLIPLAMHVVAGAVVADSEKDYDAGNLAIAKAVPLGILSFISLCVGAACAADGLSGWLAPLPSILGL